MLRHIAKVSLLSLFCASTALTTTVTSSVAIAKHQDAAATADDHFDDLVTMLDLAVKKFGDKPLFGIKNAKKKRYEWLSFKQFSEKVDHMRSGLAQIGVGPHDKVAMIANNSAEWAITCYGTMSLSAAFVPMYTNQLPEEWAYKLKDSQARVVFVADTSIYNKVKDLPRSIPTLKHVVNLASDSEAPYTYAKLLAMGQTTAVPAITPSKDDVMGLIYTSGTTGAPKGVMLTHGNVATTLEQLPKVIPIEGERSVSFLPWAHVFGQLAEVHSSIRLGNATALAEKVPATLLDDLKIGKPTLFFAVPRVYKRFYSQVMAIENDKNWSLNRSMVRTWHKVMDARRKNEKVGIFDSMMAGTAGWLIKGKVKKAFGGKLKMAVSGGAKLSPDVATFFSDLGIAIYEGYGLSETSGIISINTPDANKIGSVGKIFPTVDINIADATTNAAGFKEGRILVRGPNIMKGYHNQEELTQKQFDNGWLDTGDLGYVDQEGFIFITGRAKDSFKLDTGKFISPADYEEKLKLSSFVKEAVLVGKDKPFTSVVIEVNAEALLEHAKAHHYSENLAELLASAEIRKLFDGEIAKAAETFPSYFKPKEGKFVLVTDDWIKDNLLTPTLKVKRAEVLKKYASQIATMY